VERIYLDHAATTIARSEVIAAMVPLLAAGNPSSLHAEGRAAHALLDGARERVALVLGAKAREIVFTGGGSESNNLAILGVARALRERGRHIISTVFEHHAVLHALDVLREDGYSITLLPVGPHGVVDPGAFRDAIRPDTVLASIMLANNEIGTIQPVRELAAIARERGVIVHTDAVQAPAYLDVNVETLGIDLLSIAAPPLRRSSSAGGKSRACAPARKISPASSDSPPASRSRMPSELRRFRGSPHSATASKRRSAPRSPTSGSMAPNPRASRTASASPSPMPQATCFSSISTSRGSRPRPAAPVLLDPSNPAT